MKSVTSTVATVASVGNRTVDKATSAATTKATEVKKPKTFWMRTREECIVCYGVGVSYGNTEVLGVLEW